MAPQNSLPGSVDIINQKTGNVVAQYAQNSDRVVNLTETSIVRINASPESVNFYERQGNDLIVHMKDGTTVRYQSFFELNEDGLHSQLVFDDNLGTHHAVFPYAAEAGPATAEAIVPTYTDVGMDSLVGASGISALAVLGGIAAVGGIIGIAAAAGGGGGGGGGDDNNGIPGGGSNPDNPGGGTSPGGGDNGGGTNPGGGDNGGGTSPGGGDNGGGTNPGGGDNGGGTEPEPGTPTLRLAVIGTDNMLNANDILVTQAISGSTEAAYAGSQVVITSGNYTWTTVVESDGSWVVFLPPSVLSTFAQGTNQITVTLTTPDGVTVTETTEFQVDTIPPALTLTAFAPGDIVGQDMIEGDKLVRGYSTAADEGSQVTVTLNGKIYTTTVDASGQWQLTIPQADMALLQDGESYSIAYRIVDAAGNVTQEQRSFTTNFSTPTITIDELTGDNVVNSAEVLLNQTLSGQTVNVPAGQIVTITLNGKTYYAQVEGDGSWKTVLPAGDLGALAQGDNALNVSVVDRDGNTITNNVTITVDTAQPGIAIAILSTDDYLSAAEAALPLEVRGVTTVTGPGATLVVTLNGKEYVVSNVDEAGYWSVTIPSADLLQLQDGPVVITASVTLDDQFALDQHTLNVQINHLPQPTLAEPFGDGFLNGDDKTSPQTLSGNTGVSGGGQHVTVNVGGKTYQAIVDGDGNWKVTVPVTDLQTFPDGQLPITVSASDAAGNTTSVVDTAVVDTVAPALTVLPLTGDDRLNVTELGQDQVLNGVSAVSERGQTVTVSLNGKSYTTVVGEDGNWQVVLPAADLGQLGGGTQTVSVTLTDAAGNSTTVAHDFAVKTSALTLSVLDFTSDNTLNAAEIKVDQFLRGATNAEAGSVVTVNLGGASYQGVVDALGNWQVLLPAVELQKLTDGTTTYSVSVNDAFGQTQNIDGSFAVDTTTDAVAINIVADDDYLSQAESTEDLVVRGSSAGLPEGTTITLTLNGETYTGQVGPGGAWAVTIGAENLADLDDGLTTITASATTPAGTVSDSHDFTVIINNLPQLQIDQPFVDGTISQAESGVSQLVTGSTNVAGAGQTVVATLNGQQYIGVVDADGNWSVTLPTGALESLPDGAASMTVEVRDAAGNASSQAVAFAVDKTPPAIVIQPINGTDALNSAAVAVDQVVSITASDDAASVTVTLNGVTYPATLTDGVWQATLPAAALAALPNGASAWTVTATDGAGNVTTVNRSLTLDTTAPNVVVDPVTRDNQLDIAELSNGFSLTGRTVPAEPGAQVSVTINGNTVTGVVAADGSWSVPIAAGSLAGLDNGAQTLTVTVTDTQGNASPAQSINFSVDTSTSAIAFNPIEADDRISAADILDGLTVSGITARVADGATVTITLNGKQYTTQVDASGNWELTINQADAAAIADGTATLTVSARDVDNLPVSSERQFTIITHQLPQPVINTPFTDGVINTTEAAQGGTLTGATGSTGSGQTVTVTVDNLPPLTATVDANGNWSLPLTPGLLGDIGQGNHTVTVTATDAAGNQNSATTPLVIDTTAPSLAINPVTSDNIVNTVEAGGALTISGTGTYDPQNAQIVSVLVNGQSYDARLQADGTWSITLPAGALAGVQDGPVTVRATIIDAAGNSTTVSSGFTLDASATGAPVVQVNKIAGDDFINAAEGQSGLVVSGTTLRVEEGRPVTVTLNGQTYTTEVAADGRWTLTIPQNEVAAVPDGAQTISVSVTDLAGNTASANHSVVFAAQPASQPTLVINTIAQDDVINAQEQDAALDITGSSTRLAAGTVVTVTLNAKTYTGTVDSSGNWKVTVPPADLQALSDSNPLNPSYALTASATDAAQNPATATHEVVVDTTGPAVVVNVGASIFADGFINIAEARVDQTVTGTGTPGQTVVLEIGGQTLSAAVGNNGNWSMTLPAAQLQALGQGPVDLAFYSVDAQGNRGEQIVSVEVNTQVAPTLTLGPIFADNKVNISEAGVDTTLTGATTGLPDGALVTVTIGTQTFTGSVTDNVWTVTVGAGELNTSGLLPVTVTAQDDAGNPATATAELDVILTAPAATLPGVVFGDNFIGQAEANAGAQLTGSTGQTGPGQIVAITLDTGELFPGTVDGSGNWTVNLTPQQLNDLADGTHTMTVTVTDRAGNSTTSEPPVTFTVLTDPLTAPQVPVAFTDGFLSADEITTTQTLSGTLNTPVANIDRVTVSLNNGAAVQATVNPNGTWSLDLSPATLAALPDGVTPVNVTVIDKAGNQITGQGSFEVLTNNLPQVTINTPFTDGAINFDESQGAGVITGSTGVTGPNQTVSVTFNGQPYTAVVQDTGEWTVTIPQSVMQSLPDGVSQTVTVTATDRAGNESQPVDSVIEVHTALPSPSAPGLFGDGVLNITEASGPLLLTGQTGVSGPDQYVKVQIDVNGVTYTADVTNTGVWSVELPPGALQSLDPAVGHQIIITAEDRYGNTVTQPVNFDVAFTAPTVTITTPVFNDGYVNIAESQDNSLLSGTFTSAYPANATVNVNIGGQNFAAQVTGNSWQLQLTPADWQTITATGQQSVVVTVVDGVQNAGTTSAPVTILLTEPVVTVTSQFAGDGALTFAESETAQTISGTASNMQAGDIVRVTFTGDAGGGAARTFDAIVQPNGSWSLQVSPADMATLQPGTVTVEGIDRAGNVGAATNVTSLTIDLTPPDYAVILDQVGGDNFVNASEVINGAVTITGHTLNLAGQEITLTLTPDGGTAVLLTTLTVGTDGTWSYSVPQAQLPDGTYTLLAQSVSQPTATAGSQTFTIDTITPTLTINPFTGDSTLNADEQATAQLITGTSDAEGSTVVVTLNGNTYFGQVSGGNWSVQVPQADVAALNGSSYTIQAVIRDAAGNQNTQTQDITVDTASPLLQVDALSVPAVLNTVNAAAGLLVQGQGDPGNDVTINVGPLSWTTTVDENGNWSYRFPQLDLSTLTDGPQVISITSQDDAGNVATNKVSLNVALNKSLGVVIDQVFNDGILNVAESLVTQTLTGRVNGDYRGAKVSLTIAGADLTINDLLIGADGSYSFQLPPSIWQGLINQTLTARVDVVDANGNTRYETVDFDLALTDLPIVGDVLVAADNVINRAESTVDQVITGTVSNLADVTGVVVNFGGRAVNAALTAVGDGTGKWVATLPAAILSTLPDGQATVGIAITDKFGNVVNTNASINVASNVLPVISLDPLFGNGTLSLADLANNVVPVISGTATGLAGQTLTVQLSGQPALTTNVDGTGRWSVDLSSITDALRTLGTGNLSLAITASDQYGNPATQTGLLKLDLVAPVVSNVVAFGDGLLSAADALLTQTITGLVSNAPLGSTVEVQIGAKTFAGTVGADGAFTINLAPSSLTGLLDGVFTPQVRVVTPEGNVGTGVGADVRVGLANLPSVVIDSLFGNDGWLNKAETGLAQTISGTVTGLTDGTVTVTVGNTPYQVPVSNGAWTLQLPAGALASVADGALNVTASVVDSVGNVVNSSQTVNAIVQAVPSLSVGPLFGNGTLDLADLLTNPLLSGTSSNLAAGTLIDVKVGPLSLTATIGANGAWQLAIPALSLQGLTDGANVLQVSATARDAAGNVATTSQLANVAIQAPPVLSITSLFGDGGLSLADLSVDQRISGTSQNAAGSVLTVTLGTKSYNTTVAADGSWNVTVPKADLSLLGDGQPAVSVSVKNAAGNTATTSGLLDVITHNLPTVTLNPLFGGDGLLNISEAASGQLISGKITGVATGAKVVVTVGGVQLNANVGDDGTWSTTVNNNILQSLTSGAAKVGVAVTDRVGNTTATAVDVGVKLTQPTLSLVPLTAGGLLDLVGGVVGGVLGPVLGTSKYLTLRGTSTNLEQGSTVNINLLNTVNATAKTAADGSWSAQVLLTVDLLAILSLSTVVHLSAADTAGNMAYLNVGLGGGGATTTPPTSTLAAEANSFSLLAASAVESSDSANAAQPESNDTTTVHTAAAATVESTTTSAASEPVTVGSYSIGGLSIDLADGTHQSGDSVQGGSGNDTIHLSTLGFTQIDGGAGTDTLALDGINLILNLVDATTKVQHIEIIDLGKSGTNGVTLDLHEALTITDKPEDDLLIKGSTGDQVTLKQGANDIWAVSGQREVDGVQFDIYHNSSQSNTLGDVLIQHGLHVNVA